MRQDLEGRFAEIESAIDLDAIRAQREAEAKALAEREEAERERQHRLRDAQRELSVTRDLIIDGMERANGLAIALADEIESIISNYAEAARLCRLISGKEVPINLSPLEVERWLGCLVAAALSKHRRRLGNQEFNPGHIQPDQSWKTLVKVAFEKHVDQLMETD